MLIETRSVQYKVTVFRPSVCHSVTSRYYHTERRNVTRK